MIWDKKIKLQLAFTLGGFAVLYTLISFLNHYLFRTYALDLGLYTQALDVYMSGNMPTTSMFQEDYKVLLADHFDFYLPLFSPLKFIFGTYTLLVVQIVAILLGGLGVFKYVAQFVDRKFALPALVCFLAFFGVFSAVSYDYHSNVVAAMVLPWLFISFRKEKIKTSLLLLLFMLLGKENMGIWLFFVMIGLAIIYFKEKRKRNWALIFAGLSVVYFLVVLEFILPSITPSGAYHGFHYSALGKSFGEALTTLVTRPFYSFQLLYKDVGYFPTPGAKIEFYVFLCLSGGILLLRKPAYIIMMLPLIGQKMFHDNHTLWGVHFQYSIEFAPILVIGAMEVIKTLPRPKYHRIVVVIIVLTTLGTSIRLMDNTHQFSDKSKLRFYKSYHYTRDFDVDEVYEAMALIPDDAAVSAQNSFVPHLSLRERVYQFPLVLDADYILLHFEENVYPFSEKEQLEKHVSEFQAYHQWEVLIEENGLYLLRRPSKTD